MVPLASASTPSLGEPSPLAAAAVVRQSAALAPLSVRNVEAFGSAFDGDESDPQRASEYATDIMARLMEEETAAMPNANYMDGQADLNPKMRSILVDWLIEVHMKYKMMDDTLYLAINIIDRYLSVRVIPRHRLQLIGVVALFIAAKFEEIDPPRAHEFAYITDKTCSKKEVVNMEARLLSVLEFKVVVPTASHFLDRLQRVNNSDSTHRALTRMILETSLLDMRSARHPPSVLVSSAILLSNEILNRRSVWPSAMVHHTRRSEAALKGCVEDLKSIMDWAKSSQFQVVQKKYKLDQNHAVAKLVPNFGRA